MACFALIRAAAAYIAAMSVSTAAAVANSTVNAAYACAVSALVSSLVISRFFFHSCTVVSISAFFLATRASIFADTGFTSRFDRWLKMDTNKRVKIYVRSTPASGHVDDRRRYEKITKRMFLQESLANKWPCYVSESHGLGGVLMDWCIDLVFFDPTMGTIP